jgi:hypothetical protein
MALPLCPCQIWVVPLILTVAIGRGDCCGSHNPFCPLTAAQSPPVLRVDTQGLHTGQGRETDEFSVIGDRSVTKQPREQSKSVIGQGRIDERLLAFEGLCGAADRKPTSNIRTDKFREGCRNRTRRFDNSFV